MQHIHVIFKLQTNNPDKPLLKHPIIPGTGDNIGPFLPIELDTNPTDAIGVRTGSGDKQHEDG